MGPKQHPYLELTAESGVPVKAWVNGVQLEDAARKQLLNVSQLPFVFKWVAAMPDVHWGVGEHTDYGLLTLLAQEPPCRMAAPIMVAAATKAPGTSSPAAT